MRTQPSNQVVIAPTAEGRLAGGGGVLDGVPSPAPATVSGRTSMLVVDSAEVRVGAIKRWAKQQAWVQPIFTTTAAAAVEAASREQPEVVLLDLLFRGGRGVALAIELKRLSPAMEPVMVVEDPGAPEVQVAFEVGCTRLVRADALATWLDVGLPPLARVVRAERQLAVARREADELAAGNVRPEATTLPLSVAERRYREAYLRTKLAQAGGRREAAALAGIPYTTFCVMLRKLGIRV